MEKGGLLGRPIELIPFDNQSTPLGSRQAALEAIAAGVVSVIGPAWSSHAMITGPILQQAKIPMIASNATHEKVTKGLDYVFRSCFIDPFQGAVMAKFAIDSLNAKTAVVLTNVSSEYSIGLLDIFSRTFTQHSGQIIWKGEYREKQIDFAQLLLQIKELKPDVVYIPGHHRDTGLILKQAYQLGIKTRFLGSRWHVRRDLV
jgi:branched-chain amino acid transport system substrate-binding protein